MLTDRLNQIDICPPEAVPYSAGIGQMISFGALQKQ